MAREKTDVTHWSSPESGSRSVTWTSLSLRHGNEALTIARRTGAGIIKAVRDASGRHERRRPRRCRAEPSRRTILRLVAERATSAQIARALGISPATPRKHPEHAYDKLGVSTRQPPSSRRCDASSPQGRLAPAITSTRNRPFGPGVHGRCVVRLHRTMAALRPRGGVS